MEALRLNTEAIRERVLNQAAVVKYTTSNKEFISVLIPISSGYVSLETGTLWRRDLSVVGAINNSKPPDWIIRPGDEAEFSTNGEEWVKGIYRGIDGLWLHNQISFCKDAISSSSAYYFIRPVQTDPEKAKRLERIANLERELAELKKLEA